MVSKDNGEIVRCNKCKIVLDEPTSLQYSERNPCPVCGSLSRYHERAVNVAIDVSITKAEEKAKRLGKGRPFIEQRAKRELYRKTGQDTDEIRIIDRKNNLYKKIIKDSKTGETIYERCEPLSEHVGHGSAKSGIKR